MPGRIKEIRALLQPLDDFDGLLRISDDKAGQKHMEYVNERGSFDDLPLQAIAETFRRTYPQLASGVGIEGDFGQDGAAERQA